MWYHPPRSLLFFIKIIIKQKPTPIMIVLFFLITIFPISKQIPAFIKYFPVFWQFQDVK